MVDTYYVKLFGTGAGRHNSVLMFLLLLVTETKIIESCKNKEGYYSLIEVLAFSANKYKPEISFCVIFHQGQCQKYAIMEVFIDAILEVFFLSFFCFL